jgi:hypothetical protein
MEYDEVLRELAKKHLSVENQLRVDDLIDDNDQDTASISILGAIDGQWDRGEISDEEAATDIARLNLSADRKARIRSSSEHVGTFK